MRDEVRDLVQAIMSATGEAAADNLASALHYIVTSASDICDAFNRAVERQRFNDELERRGLRRVPLRRLATKNEFGAN